ncbi:hypothetical protein CRYUN_Cryun06bG0024700 [Craigia yunnanensis]
MCEEEFGLPSDGPIRLPCDSVVMNYIVSLLLRGLDKDLEKAVVNSVASSRCSSNTYFRQGRSDQQSLICGFRGHYFNIINVLCLKKVLVNVENFSICVPKSLGCKVVTL